MLKCIAMSTRDYEQYLGEEFLRSSDLRTIADDGLKFLAIAAGGNALIGAIVDMQSPYTLISTAATAGFIATRKHCINKIERKRDAIMYETTESFMSDWDK